MQPKDKPRTLCDAGLASQRSVSWRSLLGIVAIGATAVAVVTAASAPGAEAAKLKSKTPRKAAIDYIGPIGGIKGETIDERKRRGPRVQAK